MIELGKEVQQRPRVVAGHADPAAELVLEDPRAAGRNVLWGVVDHSTKRLRPGLCRREYGGGTRHVQEALPSIPQASGDPHVERMVRVSFDAIHRQKPVDRKARQLGVAHPVETAEGLRVHVDAVRKELHDPFLIILPREDAVSGKESDHGALPVVGGRQTDAKHVVAWHQAADGRAVLIPEVEDAHRFAPSHCPHDPVIERTQRLDLRQQREGQLRRVLVVQQ